MKRQLAKILTIVLTLGLVFSLSGCGNDSDLKKIGIIQIVEHPSLDTIRETIISELKNNGYVDNENILIDYQCAQGEQSNLKSIAQKFVSKNYDLIIAIATPSAQSVMSETDTIPIIFSAVTDPMGSLGIENLDKPGGNVTGTSDLVLADQIMELGLKITPDIKTVGALYNSSETNSVFVIDNLKEFASKNNLTVIEAPVTNASEIPQALNSLLNKVDAIFIPIDNTVASAMPTVAQTAIEAKIPVYVGADSMVKDGGLATFGVNYTTLGKETARIVMEVLEGKNPGDIPVKTINDYEIYVNQSTADAIGITIPEEILQDAAQVFK